MHEAVRILVEIADALAYAHTRGVVHRDIKPDNVLLSGRHALVMDFGVAKAVSEATGRQKLTTAGVALGTPAYMAPEQATADPALDHRVDIYAVGVVGYELLTGRTPFAGLTPQQTLAAHVTEPPPAMTRFRPSVSPGARKRDHALPREAARRPMADSGGAADPARAAQHAERRDDAGGDSAGRGGARRQRLAPSRGSRCSDYLRGGRRSRRDLRGPRRTADALTLGRRTQVTLDPGLEIDPALSPDGRLIAYASGALGRTRIMVRQLEGGGGNTIPITGGAPRRPEGAAGGRPTGAGSPTRPLAVSRSCPRSAGSPA